jgi:hypothetical protein
MISPLPIRRESVSSKTVGLLIYSGRMLSIFAARRGGLGLRNAQCSYDELYRKYHDARDRVEEPDEYGRRGEFCRLLIYKEEGNPATALPSAATANYQHPEHKRPSDDVGLQQPAHLHAICLIGFSISFFASGPSSSALVSIR